ncbi:MAG TPA: DUF4476 domain-containing protein [Puia sp.]|nr:DUF4476 domain-containing protein [Puia sp.]
MPKTVWVTLFFLIAGRSYTQTYFVLIRADNSQPFYVHTGGRSFSSSGQGHLIVPQLKDSTYTFTIGFPKKLFPEQEFVITINRKDLEYQLKNMGEKGWGLFNPQTLELKMPVKIDTPATKLHPDGVRKDDAFSRLMAGVVSDTAVMYNTYAIAEPPKDAPREPMRSLPTELPKDSSGALRKETPKADTEMVAASAAKSPSVRADSIMTPVFVATPPSLNASGIKRDLSKDSSASKTSFIEKLSEKKTAKGMRLVYTDHIPGSRADTILIIIPADSSLRSLPARQDTLKKGTGPPVLATRPTVINSDCRDFATAYDVDKLRVKLLATPRDDDKLLAARKVFKTKCFSTAQIRALSEVFAAEGDKYRFLETAYPFVSDEHFPELSALFADPLYGGRFRAMTGR